MKFVAWNCRDVFERKLIALLSMEPDVAVISEVRREALAALPVDSSHVWLGAENGRRVCVIGFGEWKIAARGAPHGNWFLPFSASTSRQVLTGVGVWTETGQTPYEVTAEDAVANLLAESKAPMLIAGDFNLSEHSDPRRLVGARISRSAELLAGAGFSSVWHGTMGEAFGRESKGTYFHYWREAEPFHIDYIFLDPLRLAKCRKVAIGEYADWVAPRISDHVPLTIQIDDDALRFM